MPVHLSLSNCFAPQQQNYETAKHEISQRSEKSVADSQENSRSFLNSRGQLFWKDASMHFMKNSIP